MNISKLTSWRQLRTLHGYKRCQAYLSLICQVEDLYRNSYLYRASHGEEIVCIVGNLASGFYMYGSDTYSSLGGLSDTSDLGNYSTHLRALCLFSPCQRLPCSQECKKK